MPFFSSNSVGEYDFNTIFFIGLIGEEKNKLPENQRGWCNELGLTVILNERFGVSKVEAGRDGTVFMSATRNSPSGDWDVDSGDWDVDRYENGEWEQLVNPTLKLTNWLAEMGGLPDHASGVFNSAVSEFRQTGELNLPGQNF